MDKIVEEWRAPCLQVSKIQYGQTEEYKSYFRLWPKVNDNAERDSIE